MKTVIRFTALALAVSANVGVTSAAYHPSSFGKYSTAVAESRLFVKDTVTTLRCDLFFSVTDSDKKWVAPKGTVVSQSVPSFVWQYSGLLPVSDYLRTVAIHSVSSEEKQSAWQDVQLTFYKGLRAEGARESDAKIAYAGAYAFAPRWPLVEFVDITVPERDKETRLYEVKYTLASAKGISVADYQSIASDILAAPEAVTLQDIRGIIDAADTEKMSGNSEGNGSLFGRLFKGRKDKKAVKDPVEDLFIDKAMPPVDTDDNSDRAAAPAENLVDVEALEEKAVDILGVSDSDVEGVVVELDFEPDHSEPAKPDAALQNNNVLQIWKVMPDGSEVLVRGG